MDQPFIPKRAEGELRAFVGYTHSQADMIFFDLEAHPIDLNYFKRLLLYYDRVALTFHTEFFCELVGPDHLARFLEVVNSIKPLVADNTVIFVGEPVLYNPSVEFGDAFRRLTGRELSAGGKDNDNKPSNMSERESAILADLNPCHTLDLDYVTTQPANWSAIKRWYVGSGREELQKEARHVWATSLVTSELPNLVNLTYKDIISIRKNSDAFTEWRQTLDELFELLAKNNPTSMEQLGKEVQYFSKHRISEKKRRLEEEIAKSSLKCHLKNSALIITISFLGQLIASQYIDIPLTRQMVSLITGSSGVAGVASLMGTKWTSRSKKLLAKYYSLLEEALRRRGSGQQVAVDAQDICSIVIG